MEISRLVETSNFKLVVPSVVHAEMYEQFYTDAEASKMYGGPLTQEQTWARLKADVGSWQLLGFGVWVIQSKDDGRYIGTCGFWKGKAWPTELTWWVLPEARGRGVATQVSLAALNVAYNSWHWEAVETYMNDDNHAARRLVKKLGGEKVRRMAFPDGLSRDIYLLPNPQRNPI